MFCTLDSANLVVVSCDRGGNANRTINVSKDDNYYMWESTPTFEIYSRYRLDRRTLQLTEGWVQKFGEKWASTSNFSWQCQSVQKQLSPAIAAAQVNTYLCRSLTGANPSYVIVDPYDKSVRVEQSTSGGIKCIISWRDGVYGPSFIGPAANLCAMATGNNNAAYRQSVSISGGEVVAKTYGPNGIDTLSLDLQTGRLQSTGGEEAQCQRAHM